MEGCFDLRQLDRLLGAAFPRIFDVSGSLCQYVDHFSWQEQQSRWVFERQAVTVSIEPIEVLCSCGEYELPRRSKKYVRSSGENVWPYLWWQSPVEFTPAKWQDFVLPGMREENTISSTLPLCVETVTFIAENKESFWKFRRYGQIKSVAA